VLVINTSGTLNAALPASLTDGRQIRLHLSTRLADDTWVVELRQLTDKGTGPFYEATSGLEVTLPAGATATLCAPYEPDGRDKVAGKVRLWSAKLTWTSPWQAYLRQHGRPIRYSYVPASWGSDYYQSVYATEPGSAEMPSAGRAFTPEVITRLVAKGVVVAPLTLHTGVSSLEGHESPYPEYFQVPDSTARLVNAARALGNRIIAVGTTVVRALESTLDNEGNVEAREGWTNLVISRQCKPHLVDGLLTGLHEPGASHLAMLEAIAGFNHLRQTYAEALREQYLWHEFGDMHLILPF
jgi:S-adenosylmethionine:tRNA ribosyltransferase-isomerase